MMLVSGWCLGQSIPVIYLQSSLVFIQHCQIIVEYGWNQLHEDLEVVRDVKLLLNEGDEVNNPFDNNHGTAVLGEMVGTPNTFGVKGISHGAKARMAPENTKNLGSNRANAIILAVNDGKAGDIILLVRVRCKNYRLFSSISFFGTICS